MRRTLVDRLDRHDAALRVFLTLLACASITALVVVIPPVHFAYPYVGAAVAVSAFASASALAICVLFFTRYRRDPNNVDLLISFLFGLTALVEAVLPLIEGGSTTRSLAFWSRLTTRMVVAFGLCLAAWMPARWRAVQANGRRFSAAVFVATTAIVLVTVVQLPMLPAAQSDGNAVTHDISIRGMRILGAILLLAAAIGFVRRSRSGQLWTWLAIASVALACGRFNDFLYPTLQVNVLTTADLFRLAGQTVLLLAAAHELSEFWARHTAEAKASERRRLAAELHDGLAQELAYLSMVAAMAEADPGNGDHLRRARDAAERALAEARLAVAEFALAGPVSLTPIIEQVSRVVEARWGCKVICELDDIVVEATTAHELSRAARELLTNAARHAHATLIFCRLDATGRSIRLEVSDDGEGMTSTTFAGHFGLDLLRSRAQRLGGECSVQSVPSRGTHVAIEVPAS